VIKHLFVRVVATLAVVGCVASGAGAMVGAATAANSSGSYTFKATLNVKQEVPAAKDAIHATGVVTGRLTLAGKKSTFTWRLKASHLSGRILTAAVSVGKPGQRGSIVLPLCNKCHLTSRGAYTGSYVAKPTFVKPFLHRGLYVNVTTKLNPKGEIRGQIKATAA
jgi:CHRD domain-containing protein